MHCYCLLIVDMFVFVFVLVEAVFKGIPCLKLGNLPFLVLCVFLTNKLKHGGNNFEVKNDFYVL